MPTVNALAKAAVVTPAVAVALPDPGAPDDTLFNPFMTVVGTLDGDQVTPPGPAGVKVTVMVSWPALQTGIVGAPGQSPN
jgi:hypothetical protein